MAGNGNKASAAGRPARQMMTAALTPGGEYVNIIDPAVFNSWHLRKGLSCLGCKNDLTVVERDQSRFLRHRPGTVAAGRSEAHSGEETFLHNRMKHWVRNQLRQMGMTDAQVEQSVGNQTPDVYGHYQDRSFAVEVQWSPLAEKVARERTTGLRIAGVDHIVWLTRHCDWVSRIPALGIADFDPPDDEYTAFTGFYCAHSRGMRESQLSVSSFLQQWIDNELGWAYIDLSRRGWATVTDWEERTRQQSATITNLKHDLQTRDAEIGQLKADLDTKSAEANKATTDLDRVITAANRLKEENQRLSTALHSETGAVRTARKLAVTLGIIAAILLALLIVL
ncbi:hypothetical protein OH799_32970 [Nocardia sp. NBC_00881]|uniref:competence protein CoiA family protein n=1 Tax=Nocardia sp. NBC_00881 TaxID=2975995 RepID=UPI00386CCE2C|nr:hypothetical protein OH799_32970 [Nocardia sp. NBC_00881]